MGWTCEHFNIQAESRTPDTSKWGCLRNYNNPHQISFYYGCCYNCRKEHRVPAWHFHPCQRFAFLFLVIHSLLFFSPVFCHVGPVYREPGRRQRHSTSRSGRPSARLGGTRIQVIFIDKNRREGMFAHESMSRDALSRAEAAERKLADLQEHFNAVLQVLSHVSLFK